MKFIKFFIFLVQSMLIVFLLSGCWNYREIENLSIVSGIAIDKKDNKFLVTSEIINIKGANQPVINTEYLSSEGDSFFDAVRNIIKISGKKLYFAHAETVIISKAIAEDGIIPVLDWISRDNEPRYTLHLLISKDKLAKDIFKGKPITSESLSFKMKNTISSEKSLSKIIDIEVWQFINDLFSTGISATLPLVDLKTTNDEATSEITGIGVFKKDKLIGFLNGEETKMFLFVRDLIKGGALTQKGYNDPLKNHISLEILKNKTSLIPKSNNSEIKIIINTNTDVAIAEVGEKENFINEEEKNKLEKTFEKILEANIKTLVEKVQSDYDSDIFGFGKCIKINMPGLWKKIEPNWDNMFRSVTVEVNSKINIRNSGLISKPLKVGE